uniref:Uncharacterized protein n=1 Tax=Oryzias latipes TaxID=8090 RepID=A0A3B3HBR3_ORYLA
KHFPGPISRKSALLVRNINDHKILFSFLLGNVLGEGFVLGGVFVIGRDPQGILLEHREMEFGDKVNISDVLHAARRITRDL